MLEEEAELDEQSGFWIGAWTSALLIFFTIFFDVCGEKVSQHLEEKVGVEADVVSADEEKAHALFSLKLWRRFRGEVTTLGFLAFTVYIFAECHFFKAVVTAASEIHPLEEVAEEEAGEEERRRMLMAVLTVPGQRAVQLVRQSVLAASAPAAVGAARRYLQQTEASSEAGSEASSGEQNGEEENGVEANGEEGGEAEAAAGHRSGANGCERYMTPSKEWLKEHVEAVHYSFFISMCLYFVLIAIAITIFNTRFTGKGKRWNDPGFERRTSFLLAHARQWPAVQALAAHDPKVQAALDRGTFSYAMYVQCASVGIVDIVIEFPWTTWLVALGYQLALALLSGNACVDDHHLQLTMLLLTLTAHTYLGVRMLLFGSLISAGAEHAWPLLSLDRYVTFLIGPCLLGFCPWNESGKAKLALTVQQSWLWFHLQRLAFLISNENGSLFDGEPHPGILADLIITSAMMIFASVFIWPAYMELATLPPMEPIDQLEKHVCVVLQRAAAEGTTTEGAKATCANAVSSASTAEPSKTKETV